MRIPYIFLGITGVGRIASSALPPLIALLVTQSLSIKALASCLVVSAFLRFLLTPLLAPLVDRSNALRLLFICEILSAFASAFTAMLLWLDQISFFYWMLYFSASAVIQSVEATSSPKVTLKLVRHDQMTKYIGWESMVIYGSRFVGPMIGGLSLLIWPVNVALMLTLILPVLLAVPLSYFLYARFGSMFENNENPTQAQASIYKDKFQNWRNDVLSGFYMRWAISTERFLALQIFLELAFIIPTFGILLPRVVLDNHWANSWLGWLEASSGAGLVLGGVLAPNAMKWFGQWSVCIGSAIAVGLAVALCAVFVALGNTMGLAVCLFVGNLTLAMRIQAGAAQRRVAVPERVMAQFVGAHVTLNTLAAQLGVIGAAAWVSYYSATTWFLFSATVLTLLGFSLMLIPGYKALVSMDVAQAANFYEKRYPNAFN